MNGRRRIFYFSLVALCGAPLLSARAAHPNRPGIVYWRGDPSTRQVALTFDDGPNEPYTSQILNVLRQNHVRATFFMVGENVEKYPQTAREIVREGHAIGNHSYTHTNCLFDTNSRVRREILKTEKVIEETTGQRTCLFRPPFGGKDIFTLHQTHRLGYVSVQWTVSGRDWRRPGVKRIVRNVMRGVRPGAIILLHDGNELHHGSDRSQTVQALPALIAQLKSQGYTFVTVPEMLHLSAPQTLALNR